MGELWIFEQWSFRWLASIADYFGVGFSAIVNVVAVVPLTEFNQPIPSPSGGGGIGIGRGAAILPDIPTRVMLKGKAYPDSQLTVLKDGQKLLTAQSDSQANFEITISSLVSGVYTFGVWGEDKQKRRSLTFSFTTNVPYGITTAISGIILPPTIDLSKNSLQRGEVLNLLGYSAPQSEVAVHINSPIEIIKKTQAAVDGTWFYNFNTNVLSDGLHSAKVKSTVADGSDSIFSQSMSFSVGQAELPACLNKADINKDKRVNLIDLSILLYNWGLPKNTAADLNCDNRINLKDFSILLYWWTG